MNIVGGSYTLTHIDSSLGSGTVVNAGQLVGTVAPPNTRNNNGVAHIHFQMWTTSNCYSSSGIPFDSAHNARICGAPDMTPSGPSGGNGTWSGTSFSGANCGGGGSSSRVSILNGAGEVWAKDTAGYGGWAQQTGPNSAKSVSVGGTTQALVDLCGAVWAKSSLNFGDWTQETGCNAAASVTVGSTGSQVILDLCGAIWAKNWIGNGGWSQEAGCGSATSLSVGGTSVSLVNGCGAVWAKPALNGTLGGWNQQTNCNSAKSVSVTHGGLQVLVDLCDAVWAKQQITSGGWIQETGCGSAKMVRAGGNTQVLLDFCGAIYTKISISYGDWGKEADCNSASTIAVGAGGRRVLLALDNAIWAKDGNISYGGWSQEAGANSAVQVAAG